MRTTTASLLATVDRIVVDAYLNGGDKHTITAGTCREAERRLSWFEGREDYSDAEAEVFLSDGTRRLIAHADSADLFEEVTSIAFDRILEVEEMARYESSGEAFADRVAWAREDEDLVAGDPVIFYA